jgi:hypothetical protein
LGGKLGARRSLNVPHVYRIYIAYGDVTIRGTMWIY